jgi:hypothetical protein
MAAVHFNDARVELNSTDLSTYVKSVTLNVETAELDTTTMGDSWTENIGGLKSGSVQIEFVQDYADNLLDEILWGILGTVVNFRVRATSAAIGASNPEYRGSVLISSIAPFNNGVGDLATMSVTWNTSGAVTRHVA